MKICVFIFLRGVAYSKKKKKKKNVTLARIGVERGIRASCVRYASVTRSHATVARIIRTLNGSGIALLKSRPLDGVVSARLRPF